MWVNRAGNQRALVDLVHPTTEAEVVEVVRAGAREGRRVKAVGAGHSTSDAAVGVSVALDVARIGRVLALDNSSGPATVTVGAGVRLQSLSETLSTRGLALEGTGDAGAQSLAGALATGTHGTGLGFGCLATQVASMRLVTGNGEVVELRGDDLAVGAVGLGALGIATSVTLRVVPAHHLRVVERSRGWDDVVESFGEEAAAHDHYGLSWFPRTDRCRTNAGRRDDEPLDPRSPRAGASRRGPFLEMEYAVPIDATMPALGAVREWIKSTGWPTPVPVVVRASAGDALALSPAHGRPTGWIEVRVPRAAPHERWFRAVEAIMVAHGGRPHWGKLHFRTAADLSACYPRWDDFARLRARTDPAGVFANAFTRRLLGPPG